MRLRFLIGSLLLTLLSLVCTSAQMPELTRPDPVRIQQIRRALRYTPETPDEVQKTNQTLIEAVRAGGVNFVLSKEEEWALSLQNASDELIETIRNATPAEERERLLKIREQEGLYLAFVNNYSRNDLTSRRIAVEAGREFIRRFSNDSNVSEIVVFFQRSLPALERSIRFMNRPGRIRRAN